MGRQLRMSRLTSSPITVNTETPTIVSPRKVPAFATSVSDGVRWSSNHRAMSSSHGSIVDSSGWVSSQPQPRTNPQITTQATTDTAVTRFQSPPPS